MSLPQPEQQRAANDVPFLTIGLPFYNNQHTLENAIKSVLRQTYTNWELLLLDDGSTDDSLTIALQWASYDNRIKVLTDKQNRGLIYRLNQVIDSARGEFIARMDSDDMMLPDKLSKQMEILLQDPDIDVIDTAVYIINEADQPTGMRGMENLELFDRKRAFKQVLLFHPTVVVKTSWYKANKYDEGYIRSEDFELWCRTFEFTKFARVYEPLFLYREGKVNIKNYTSSNRTHRKMLRKNGRQVLSGPEFAFELIKSHLKSTLYRIFAVFKLQHLLSSQRNMKLSDAQVASVTHEIEAIKSWPA